MSSIQSIAAVTTKRHITGQGMTEYIIVVALIAIGCVGAVSVFGTAVQAQFANMSHALMGANKTEKVKIVAPKAKTLSTYATK